MEKSVVTNTQGVEGAGMLGGRKGKNGEWLKEMVKSGREKLNREKGSTA